MITEKAKLKAKVLAFWEKHGFEATFCFSRKEADYLSLEKEIQSLTFYNIGRVHHAF